MNGFILTWFLASVTAATYEVDKHFPKIKFTRLSDKEVLHSSVLDGEHIKFSRTDEGRGYLSVYTDRGVYHAVLYPDQNLLTSDCVVETFDQGIPRTVPCVQQTDCLFEGKLLSGHGRVRANVCSGFFIKIDSLDKDIIIQPLAHPDHHSLPANRSSLYLMYTANKLPDVRSSRLHKRSIKDLILEMMVVVDLETARYHGNDTTKFIYTVMSLVSDLFKDSSLVNTHINVVVTKLVVLDRSLDEVEQMTSDCSSILCRFCRWYQKQNPHDDADPNHSDVAAFIFREGIILPDDEVGLAYFDGMCGQNSCLIAKDTGLTSTALTITHNLGHLFHMDHDEKTTCGNQGQIMSNTGYAESLGLHWSKCSSDVLDRFLQTGQSWCLNDSYPAPGRRRYYDKDQQCQLAHGEFYRHCDLTNQDPCKRLSCYLPSETYKCIYTGAPMADETVCGQQGERKWCIDGRCVPYTGPCGMGTWSEWGRWSKCSRPCGGGVTYRTRTCLNSTKPVCGCVSNSEDVRLCNVKTCDKSLDDPQDSCCRSHNTVADSTPNCQSKCHCNESNGRLVAYPDGFDVVGSNRHNIKKCFRGEPRSFGCDGHLDSDLKLDHCGICNGDNSTCKMTRYTGRGNKTFATIPVGASGITIINKNKDFTSIYANGPCSSGEVVNCPIPEPTTKTIDLMVVGQYSWTCADVLYTYTINRYLWKPECTSVGDMVVSCTDPTETEVDDYNCVLYGKPDQPVCP